MVPVRFALSDVGDMYLNHGNADGPDAVGQGDRGMRVGPRVHRNTVVNGVGLLKFVDQVALVVRLVIIKLHIGERLTHGFKMILKRDAPVNLWFSASQQVEVGTVDD